MGPSRDELLAAVSSGSGKSTPAQFPDFLGDTASTRKAEWSVASIAPDLRDRRVEITGPTDRKMIINAMNSGANVYMADFEDANSPTWGNLLEGQRNLCETVDGTIRFASPEGKQYRLNPPTATLMVRPRGLHLPEKHLCLDGKPVPGVACGLRPVLLPQRPKAARPRQRALFLSAEIGEPPRGPVVEQRVSTGPRRVGYAAGHHPCHRADRDHSRRLRDGRDPLRVAGAFGRAELRAVGLYFQHHQEVPQASRVRHARPRRRSP